MKTVNFTPKADIEEYLNNYFNLEIFKELTEDEDWQGIFEPLEFLNLLYEQFEIVNANKEKPLSVVKHLFGLKLEQTKLYYLLGYLDTLIYQHSGSKNDPKDKQLSICRDFIRKECDKLGAELYPEAEPEPQSKEVNKYDFQKVKQHLETLKTVNDKISYLAEIKTDFLQNKDVWHLEIGTPFDKKCDLEIERLMYFAPDSTTPQTYSTTPQAKPQLGVYTNAQLVLIFYYFFKQNGIEPRRSIDISPIAKFIHLITGREFKGVVSSDFYKKLQTVPNFKTDKELINDLEAIKPLFKMVQLNEVVKMIENEIDLARNEMKQTKKNKI